MTGAPERARVDRDWSEYPIGTKAHAVMGGYWIRVQHGWKWFNGSTFPTPGGDACGACIELPKTAASVSDIDSFIAIENAVRALPPGFAFADAVEHASPERIPPEKQGALAVGVSQFE